jgi:hypothetical protein
MKKYTINDVIKLSKNFSNTIDNLDFFESDKINNRLYDLLKFTPQKLLSDPNYIKDFEEAICHLSKFCRKYGSNFSEVNT